MVTYYCSTAVVGFYDRKLKFTGHPTVRTVPPPLRDGKSKQKVYWSRTGSEVGGWYSGGPPEGVICAVELP